MWVSASLGCNARVGVYFRCSCPMRDSGLLSVHHRCLSSKSVSLWVLWKEERKEKLKMMFIVACGLVTQCDKSQLSGN